MSEPESTTSRDDVARFVTDLVGFCLVLAGLTFLVVAAFRAGATAGLAALGGALLVFGLLVGWG